MLSAMCADPPGSDSPAPLTVNYYLGCPNILVYDCFLNQFSILMLSFMIASWSLCWLNLVTIPPSPFWSPKLWFCGLQSPEKSIRSPISFIPHPPSPPSRLMPDLMPPFLALPSCSSKRCCWKRSVPNAETVRTPIRDSSSGWRWNVPWYHGEPHGMSLRKLFRSIHMCPAVFWSHLKRCLGTDSLQS